MIASNRSYQPFGSVETMSLGNGLIASNSRGLDGRLKARRLTNGSSAATPAGTKLSDIAYGYDPDGNVTSMEDKVTPARSSLYGYDAGGRVNMMVAEGSNAPANYSYTQGTNKLASLTTTVAGGAAGSTAATRTVQYDARGNPSGETRSNGAGSTQAVTIAYDGHGRMTGYSRSGEVLLTHSYNGNDDRISTTTTSAATATPDTRRFVYDAGGRVLGEYGSSASDARAEFIWMSPEVGASGSFGGDDGLSGYMPLAVAANDNGAPGTTQLLWVHANHMGVPAVYTNASGAAIAPPAGYSAPGFPGQSRTLSDLYYNRYRDYDPTTGRYIQADPIGLAGGASPYSYAMNNPLRYSDPLGLEILNLFPPNEPGLQEAAEEAYRKLPRPVQEGGLHIYGHGSPNTQCDGVRSGCDTPTEFSNKLLMERRYKYRVGQKIYLYSCLTGSTPNGFAQELSDLLQVDVEAPTKYTWYVPYGGLLGVAGKGPGGIGNPFSPGRMRRFTPQ